MDTTAFTKWCENQNCEIETSLAIDIPGDAWPEQKILQAVETCVPDQRICVVDMKVDQNSSHSYALLERKIRIPECFGIESLQLTKDIRARLIHPTPWAMPSAKTLGPQEETHTLWLP